MKFEDRVYGKQTVEKEVIKELIESKPVQRLKKVHQAGPSPFFIEDKPYITRFEHSIGVFLLLREFNASLEEQIAGLLHDVPHTAFSHVADFVFEDEGHEYHERFMEDIIYDSEIQEMLKRHGYSTEKILDESRFGLMERELPKLCADRLDYSMRDLQSHFNDDNRPVLEALTVKDGEFVFKDREQAQRYTELFIKLDSQVYASPEEVAIHEIFSDIIRKGLEEGKIDEEDLFGTDRELMEKLRNIEDEEVQRKFDILDNGIEVEINEEEYDLKGSTKARAVDPPVIHNSNTVKVSEFSPETDRRIREHLERINRGLKINIVNQSVDL